MRNRAFLVVCLAVHFGAVVTAAGQAPTELRIVVLEGEGARHNVKTKAAVQTVVEARDAEDRPLAGAQVVFQLPAAGPGGSFPGGRLQQRVTTNSRGQAASSGFVPNDEEGRFNVKVTATSGNFMASEVVAQINAAKTEPLPGARRSRKGLWILLAAAGGGGTVAALTLGGSSKTTPGVTSSLVLAPGPVTVGGPR